MFSGSSNTRLKIVGADGLTPEIISQEIDRGAKLVIYSYNFSLVVVSFKRPSGIYFIRPGESRVWKGLPFTLVSLVFGWWGIPWGVIYTIQSLHTNIGGGVDVTASVAASLAPKPAPTAIGRPQPTPVSAPAPTPPPRNPKRTLATGAILVGLVATVYLVICFVQGQSLKVALVAGTQKPYSVELNGTTRQLDPRNPLLLTQPEGEFVLKDAEGEHRFAISRDFLTRPFHPMVAVINPDRLAVVYQERTNYHPTGSTPDPNEKAHYGFLVNQTTYILTEPDYFFTEYPANIDMPSGTTSLTKSRIDYLRGADALQVCALLKERTGMPSLVVQLQRRVQLGEDGEALLEAIATYLPPKEAAHLLEARLGDRPLRIEWHRYYQNLMDQAQPAFDLEGQYRRWSDAEPDNGALLYLRGRVLDDQRAAEPFYLRAAQAKQPCAYGSYALGFEAVSAGNYAHGLELVLQAEHQGVHSDALRTCKRDALLLNQRAADVLADVRDQRKRSPHDEALFADELRLSQSLKPDRPAGLAAINKFVASLPHNSEAELKPFDRYLRGELAYGLGEEQEAAGLDKSVEGAGNQFEAAVGQRNHQAALKALAAVDEIPSRYYLVLYLTAHATGDLPAAEGYFQKALGQMDTEGRYRRLVAKHIRAATEADHAALLYTSDYVAETVVLCTALGVRFPAQQARYFGRARELNQEPAFPHLLLRSIYDVPGDGAHQL